MGKRCAEILDNKISCMFKNKALSHLRCEITLHSWGKRRSGRVRLSNGEYHQHGRSTYMPSMYQYAQHTQLGPRPFQIGSDVSSQGVITFSPPTARLVHTPPLSFAYHTMQAFMRLTSSSHVQSISAFKSSNPSFSRTCAEDKDEADRSSWILNLQHRRATHACTNTYTASDIDGVAGRKRFCRVHFAV